MIRRPAVTLTEVLAAIFIMGIGLIAILTLFPLGAMTMATAIKDGRSGQAVITANANARLYDIRRDDLTVWNMDQQSGTAGAQRTGFKPVVSPLANPDYPSYPVYCDPIGNRSMSSPSSTKLGGVIPRYAPKLITRSSNAVQDTVSLFVLLDDMNFDENGQPSTPYKTIQRQGLYSWAYMLQRPRMNDSSVTNLTVVVYKNRGLQLAASSLNATETVYQGSGSMGTNQVQVSGLTSLRRGNWILDATQESGAGMQKYGPVHAFFYRVVNVTTTGSSTTLELETSLRADVKSIIAMDNVAEVFEKGPGWLPR